MKAFHLEHHLKVCTSEQHDQNALILRRCSGMQSGRESADNVMKEMQEHKSRVVKDIKLGSNKAGVPLSGDK